MKKVKSINKDSVKRLLVFLLFLAAVNFQSVKAECILCAQFIPVCGPGEELVLQTCEACAHCKPKDVSSSSSGGIACEIPCGKRCCKTGKLCVSIDACKGKPNCKKPSKFKCVKSNPNIFSE